jgi:hypothetical protein
LFPGTLQKPPSDCTLSHHTWGTSDLFAELTPDEIVVYQGLGAVLLEKRQGGQEEQATAAEVQRDVFEMFIETSHKCSEIFG